MGNLTRELRVVEEVQSADPLPRRYIVVFRWRGEGRTFLQTIPPGGSLQKTWKDRLFLKKEHLSAYSVSAESRIAHEFSRPMESGDQELEFRLDIRLSFSVSDPRRIVEAYLGETGGDPLQRIEDEIETIAERRSNDVCWEAFTDRTADETFAADGEPAAEAGFTKDDRRRLSDLARELGIRLIRISLHRSLPDSERRGEIAEKEEAQERGVLTAKKKTAKLKVKLEGELAEAREESENRRRALERVREFHDHFLLAAQTSLLKATDDIQGFEDITRAVEQLVLMQGQLRQLTSGSLTGNADAPRAIPPSTGETRAIGPGSSETRRGPWVELLSSLGELADGSRSTRTESRALLRASLRLLSIVACPDADRPEEVESAESDLRQAKVVALEKGELGKERHFQLIQRLEKSEELAESLWPAG